jgi:hypothetical protein
MKKPADGARVQRICPKCGNDSFARCLSCVNVARKNEHAIAAKIIRGLLMQIDPQTREHSEECLLAISFLGEEWDG